MILRSKHLNSCFGFVKEEVLRILLSVIVVLFLAFLLLCGGTLEVALCSRVSGTETDVPGFVPFATGGETLESLDLGVSRAARACRRARPCSARETAGESKGIIGLREVIVSGSSLPVPINSSNSSGCVDVDACARDPALHIASTSSSSSASAPASLAVVAHARSTPLHVAHNSWLDTGRVKGPTGRRSSKGGVSGPAEDLRLSQRWRQG